MHQVCVCFLRFVASINLTDTCKMKCCWKRGQMMKQHNHQNNINNKLFIDWNLNSEHGERTMVCLVRVYSIICCIFCIFVWKNIDVNEHARHLDTTKIKEQRFIAVLFVTVTVGWHTAEDYPLLLPVNATSGMFVIFMLRGV